MRHISLDSLLPQRVLCRDGVGSPYVRTVFFFFMSRQGFGQLGLLCRDMTFCVATAALQCGTKVCRDKGVGHLVSRNSLLVSQQGRVGWVVSRPSSYARVSYACDEIVLPCGTLHYVVQLFELQCSCTVPGHCFKKAQK